MTRLDLPATSSRGIGGRYIRRSQRTILSEATATDRAAPVAVYSRHRVGIRQVRELKLVTSVLPILRSQPSFQAEWRRRFESFIARDDKVRWKPYR